MRKCVHFFLLGEDDDGDGARPESGEAYREADGMHGRVPSDLRPASASRRKTTRLSQTSSSFSGESNESSV